MIVDGGNLFVKVTIVAILFHHQLGSESSVFGVLPLTPALAEIVDDNVKVESVELVGTETGKLLLT